MDFNNPEAFAGRMGTPSLPMHRGLDGRMWMTPPGLGRTNAAQPSAAGAMGARAPGGVAPSAAPPGSPAGGSGLLNPQSGQPQPISSDMTHWAINQQKAQIAQQYDPRNLLRQTGYNGISGSSPAYTPILANMMTQGYQQRAGVAPNQIFNDALQNTQFAQQAAQAQSQNNIAGAQNQLNLQQIANQQNLGGANALASLLLQAMNFQPY